jgi:anti-sigma factor RsiW
MICKDVHDGVEAIAAGDVQPGAELRAHLETCPTCASALASARRIDAALARREAPQAPPRFAAAVLARVRRDEWRAEQHVDRLFNVAMVLALLLVAGGTAALMNLSGLLAWAGQAAALMGTIRSDVARAAAPSLATYIAAGCLLGSALVMWWWAERRLSL